MPDLTPERRRLHDPVRPLPLLQPVKAKVKPKKPRPPRGETARQWTRLRGKEIKHAPSEAGTLQDHTRSLFCQHCGRRLSKPECPRCQALP